MSKSSITKAFDNLPFILKLIFCIPALDIIWAVYRIIKGLTEGKILTLIIGILWIVPGAAFLWIIDLITMLFTHKLIFA